MNPLMIIQNRHWTARQAAEQFAAGFWSKPRKIASWHNNTFDLIDGTRRYAVEPTPQGWRIVLAQE